MNILIAYATNSSGTYEVGKLISEVSVKKGHDVQLRSVSDVTADHISKADFIFFGSNTWDGRSPEGKRLEGQLPPHFHEFRKKLGEQTFPGKKCSVYGLGDAHYTYVCASADHLKDFVDKIKGSLIGQPLRVEGFFFGMEEKDTQIRSWANDVLLEVSS
jgi:flavodoxin